MAAPRRRSHKLQDDVPQAGAALFVAAATGAESAAAALVGCIAARGAASARAGFLVAAAALLCCRTLMRVFGRRIVSGLLVAAAACLAATRPAPGAFAAAPAQEMQQVRQRLGLADADIAAGQRVDRSTDFWYLVQHTAASAVATVADYSGLTSFEDCGVVTLAYSPEPPHGEVLHVGVGGVWINASAVSLVLQWALRHARRQAQPYVRAP
eukprot:TRINITY_DN23980_c0_g1_i1.p1 TRINITY_DN23980_c0_g1~~TRINITY_DN23980_c0_g1_i1.p1  ORF type:complete len:234 (+),score=69.24 TRINITY_DN23980_c0_g1_i1:70-702(+)